MKSLPGRALPGALAAVLLLASFGIPAPALAQTAPDATASTAGLPAPGALPAGGPGTDGPRGPGATDRVVVKFKNGVEPPPRSRELVYAGAAAQAEAQVLEQALEQSGHPVPEAAAIGEVQETVGSARVVQLGEFLDEARMAALTAALEESPAVEYAEPDSIASIASVPDDPYFAAAQWNLQAGPVGIDLPAAWGRATGRGQTIAVVDTGITAHPDLDANVVPGYDFVGLHAGDVQPGHSRDGDGWDGDPRDEGDYAGAGQCWSGSAATNSSWHGTATAGTAAAGGNNGTGVAGVAYDARILPVRALGACGLGYLSDIAVAIAWAAGHDTYGVPGNPNPATVVNLSLSFPSATCPRSLQEAIDQATSRGVPVVVAAGNRNHDAGRESPANCAGVISVAASDALGSRAGYSNWGPVTLTAPGGDAAAGILSTTNAGTTRPRGSHYVPKHGTSVASPTVAGVVALLRQADPSLSPAQIADVLVGTARPLPGRCPGGCGAGLVDPRAALDRVAGRHGHVTAGAIGRVHERIGASTGPAGSPEICGLPRGGCYQEFSKGAIYWSPGSGAHWVHGGIRAAWARAGAARSPLGYPRSAELADGVGGVHQLFERGRILWGPRTGAAALHGAIGARYDTMGGGKGLLGHPLDGERGGLVRGGAAQPFEHGRILWSPATGAHSVHGAIGRTYAALGGVNGPLGYPVSQELASGSWTVQRFEGGTINWRPGYMWYAYH